MLVDLAGYLSCKNDCASDAPGSSRVFPHAHCAYGSPFYCFERQSHVQNHFQSSFPPPEGFDSNEGRHSFVRHVSETARQGDPRFHPSLPLSLVQHAYLCADWIAHRRHPSFFSNANADIFKERPLLHRRGVCLCGGNTTVLAGVGHETDVV